MELRQLEYFVAVAEEENFTRAAERVRVSQSGVSAQLRRLERELGSELIDRSSRPATLTAAGRAVLDHARRALAAGDMVRQSLAELEGAVIGRIAVGMVVGCTIAPLFDALGAFHDAHPGVELSLREDTSQVLIEDVRRGALDLALIGCAGPVPADVESVTIVAERLVVLVRPDDPLAGSKRVLLRDVVRGPVVSMPEGTGIRSVFDAACAKRGLVPRVTAQASAADAVADLAARGLGAGVLSESMAPRYAPRLVGRTIEDVTDRGLLALVWRRSGSPALRAFVPLCRGAFGLPV